MPPLHALCQLLSLLAISQTQTVVLQAIAPADEPACPGEDIVLTCSIHSSPQQMSAPPTLFWQQQGYQAIYYYNGASLSLTFGDFTTDAYFSNNNYNIVSNATLSDVIFSHNGIAVSCFSPTSVANKIIKIAGTEITPSGVTISINDMSAVLHWLPPADNSNCSFNYTVNVTNSSSMTEQMYSNSTSLILTDLTRGENYSFAVAVTDRTGQHGPWSEELRVSRDAYAMEGNHDAMSIDTLQPSTTMTNTHPQVHPSVTVSATGLASALPIITNKERPFEDQFVYQLIIGLTSGILIVCTGSLVVAILALCLKSQPKQHTDKPPKGKLPTTVDEPVYDVPTSPDNCCKDSEIHINSPTHHEEVVIHKNIAYEQVFL